MRTNMKRSIAAAGLALALPFGLAACGGDEKPSKDDVKAGMAEMLESYGVDPATMEAAGVSSESLDAYYTCIVDDIYDDSSASLLQGIADGDEDAPMSSEENSLFNSAAQNCMSELGF